MSFTLWIDADACPNPVKEIVFRAARKRQFAVVLVANQALRTPPIPSVRAVQVPAGFDVADNYLVQHAQPGDLVITQDVPLAAELVAKRVQVIGPKGQQYDADNVRQRLAARDFMTEQREAYGLTTRNPAFGDKDKQAFANALDRILQRALAKS